jgi:hypothetical protein
MRSWRSLVPILLMAVLGCSPDSSPTAANDPAFSHTGIPDINGRIFAGPGKQSICSRFPADQQMVVRAWTVDESFATAGGILCPDNSFSIPVEPGSYLLRVGLPLDQPRGRLPLRWVETMPVDVAEADVVRDIHVRDGIPLGGGARVDGVPVAGFAVNVQHTSVFAGAAGVAISTASGTWEDFFQGGPVYLQRDIRITFPGCLATPVPGIREIRAIPADSILFPTESSAFNCDFFSGDALQFTHRATRLKLSSFPGDIGGVSDPLIFPDIGYGYSAQFPLPRGESPNAGPQPVNRQLFRGGLVLAVAPDLAISGTELGGYVICAVSPCRSLGDDGQGAVKVLAGGKREVTWIYSDTGSQRPKGLSVVQRSFDGQNGDYVLYAFRVTNQSRASITLTPGTFMDFDVTPDFGSNTGYSELAGQLMITTTADDVGRHFGTVVIGGPAGGRSYFFTSFDLIPESDVVAAIRGEISNPTTLEPTDVRALQGGTTVKLGKAKSTEFWMAVVAGDDRAQIIANARAAIAEGAARKQAGNTFVVVSKTAPVRSLNPQARAASAPSSRICKRNCSPD